MAFLLNAYDLSKRNLVLEWPLTNRALCWWGIVFRLPITAAWLYFWCWS